MDKETIQKTIVQKLSKRQRLLKNALKPDTNIKVYTVRADSKRRKSSSDLRANNRANSRLYYQECIDCERIYGLLIYKPFYKNEYLNSFYYELEATYYANRYNDLLINQYNGYSIFFDKLNLYQVLEYSYQISPTLGMYLFRFLVDMAYLLGIRQTGGSVIGQINTFYLNSQLIILRYDNQPGTHSELDNVIRNTIGQVVVMPLGSDVSVYDLVPPTNPAGTLRIFFKKGSIMVISDAAKRSWIFTVPNELIYPGSVKYELILMTTR